ncbi:GDSL-type esterase/lipase family protein [Thalassobacillus pellis]|uniref:GDSL-type esterase/lipase family protein n=1 Tax=Thalassobacillus pellis TaxID=748008 RepID=UPI0019619145|nr:lysophospholipase L1-like esterase [Thalassobacillus pellis]
MAGIEKRKVLVTGDSLALPRREVKVRETYPVLLQKNLLKLKSNIKVINHAQYGQTIIGVSQSIEADLASLRPDMVILHVGIVDCWPRKELRGKPKTDLKSFKKHYIKIVNLVKKHNIPLIIVGICPTSIRMDNKYPNTLNQIAKYNNVLKSESNKKDIFFLDMANFIDSSRPNTYLLLDDQHLNRRGSRLVFKLINNHLIRSGFIRIRRK